MSHNIHERIRNLSPVSFISLALLFFYFIIRYQHESSNNHKVRKLKSRELRPQTILQNHNTTNTGSPISQSDIVRFGPT